jgi:hypothetical protein
MKRKLFLVGMLAIVAAFGLVVAGCDDGKDSGSSGGGGGGSTSGLTISDGLPTGTWTVYVFSESTSVSGIESVGNAVAFGSSAGVSGNIIYLYKTGTSEAWTGTGSFRVYRLIDTSNFSGYKTVAFTNGNGTQTKANIF